MQSTMYGVAVDRLGDQAVDVGLEAGEPPVTLPYVPALAEKGFEGTLSETTPPRAQA